VASSREQDERAAAAWWKRNAKKVPGGVSGQQSPAGRRDAYGRIGEGGQGGRRVFQLLDEWDIENWPVVYDERNRFVPLQGQDHNIDLASAAMSARVRHVLSFMPESQRQELVAHYVEGVPLSALQRGEESRQAVHNRLVKARRAFLRAWLEHAADDVVVKEEDF
jgi:DNA-directed RNA polymerase specialized sigma24 family protein